MSQSKEWDEIVKSFAKYDVYYLSGYVRAFMIHGDGEPQLLYFETADFKSAGTGLKAIYVYMKRKTDLEGYYDSVTPYGYGGVLFEFGIANPEQRELLLQAFWKEYLSVMEQEHIVDNFVRYHPVLANVGPMKSISNVTDLGKTIAIDLTSSGIIWENIISKNRNMIRKAEKNGVEIRHGKNMTLFEDFRRIYNATMERDNAEEYYFFGEQFYESIHNDLHDNYEMFYAVYEGQIIAMSIILYANNQMHYHLSGSLFEYRNLNPSSLLLYKAALWGCKQGFKTFHLGGGVGCGEDNLYKFKAAFNRNSDYQFSVGKEIFDQEKYDELVTLRASQDAVFDQESNYFPLYRA